MSKGLFFALIILLAVGCRRDIGYVQKPVADGDAAAGRDAIINYGCGACHMIPGIPNANAFVGPPLNEFEQRHYIAGNLPNTVDNLIYWIQFPQSVEPGTAMPNLNVTAADARNITAYLYGQ
ncbi:MAG: c-type cytochrome [Burkholderiales bacterium]|nr:c-type cytochrome [Anaerolineae bacterium]